MAGALTIKTLAERWDSSTRHVYNLIRDGKLKSFKIGTTRGIRISETEVERWESGLANSDDTAGTASPSNGGKESPLPLGAMKELVSGNA